MQGVFFRAFIASRAVELGLSGYARNLPDGAVEVWAEGEKGRLGKLADVLREGPPAARVEAVEIRWSEYTGSYAGFEVRR